MSPTVTGPFLAHYQDLYDKGWHPLPALPGAKHPWTTDHHGGQDHVTDPTLEELEAYGARMPRSEVVIRMPYGVIGIDFDLYKGGGGTAEIDELEAKYGRLPDTYASSSKPWPDEIRYFRLPEGAEDTRFPGKIGNIDFITRTTRPAKVGGVHHKTGQPYGWRDRDGRTCEAPHVEDLAELPQGWLSLEVERLKVDLADYPDLPAPLEWRSAVLEPYSRALVELQGDHGSRHDGANSALMSLANAVVSGTYPEAKEAIEALRSAWMDEMPAHRDGGWDEAEREWDRMLAGAMAKALPIAPPPDDWADSWPVTLPAVESDDTNDVVQGETPKDYLMRHLMSVEDIERLPPPKWWVKGWLPQTGIVSIVGSSGSYKSFLAFDLALTLSCGLSHWHGNMAKYDDGPPRVLYMAGEGASGLPQRLAAWKRQHPEATQPPNLTVLPLGTINLRNAQWAEAVKGAADEIDARIIIVDTVAQFSGAMDENGKEMMEFVEGLKRIRGDDLSGTRLAIGVHHFGKDERKGARGHSSWYAALDFEISCTKPIDQRLAISVTKAKDSDMGLRLAWEMKRHQVGTDEDGDAVTSLALGDVTQDGNDTEADPIQRAALELIEAHPDGISFGNIERALNDAGFDLPQTRDTIRKRYLTPLADSAQIMQVGKGAGSRYFPADVVASRMLHDE